MSSIVGVCRKLSRKRHSLRSWNARTVDEQAVAGSRLVRRLAVALLRLLGQHRDRLQQQEKNQHR